MGIHKRTNKYTNVLFYRWLASSVHALGMAAGMKNSMGIADDLVDVFEYAINEECHHYDECGDYESNFVKQNKPIFGVEYVSSSSKAGCSKAASEGISRKYSSSDDGDKPYHNCFKTDFYPELPEEPTTLPEPVPKPTTMPAPVI